MLYPLSYGASGLPGKDASVGLRGCSMRRPASGRDAAARLGLAIARNLVVAHGGELVVEATGSAGSTFRVTLPR